MPNNPVQIVLNDRDFHRAPDPGQPPWPKDFFVGNDKAFAAHRGALIAAVQAIIDHVEDSDYGAATYVKVQMREEALAKSYRPVEWLFQPDQFPCVGAEAVGTLFFRAPLIYLRRLKARIAEAETTVRIAIRKRDQKPYPSPTKKRGEVGAIETIEIAAPQEKREFSTVSAMQMLSDPASVSGYQIDLFEQFTADVIADDPTGRADLFRSLQNLFISFGRGARVAFASKVGRTPVLEFQLTTNDRPAIVDNRLGLIGGDVVPLGEVDEIDFDTDRHDAALLALQNHPLVRAIRAPVRLELVDQTGQIEPPETGVDPVNVPEPVQDATYPIVGVIDSGISDVLDSWVVERFDFLNDDEFDAEHGTLVAGMVTLAEKLNEPGVVSEPDGCVLFDIPLYPKSAFMKNYPGGFSEFLGEVEQAVSEAKSQHGVRVFNLSINAVSDVERHNYSQYAAELDRIADTHGVIFVNSAGNLKQNEARAPWPKKPAEVVKYFANRTSSDTIFKPSESVRSISVGALNPPTNDNAHLHGAPTVYTRRGPGLQVGVKPDVAAYGGAGVKGPNPKTGLTSISSDGCVSDVTGTSFAAPMVARTLAGLDVATAGTLGTEALRAMLLHNASMPDPLTKRGLRDLGRQFAGYGQPSSAQDMLETDDHQITLLFQSRLSIGETKPVILRFPFTWPQSLVSNGACSGRARMTLVYAPPLDPAFGAEFVRVNLEASLKQRQAAPNKKGEPRFTNQIDAKYLPKRSGLAVPEKALIDHGLKWWPAKQYEKTYDMLGVSSEWRLEVTSLVRAEATFPAEGVPFAVLLTLDDPKGGAPVFQETQQMLQTSAARTQALQSTMRVRTRG
ncbi:MAG: S8 family peptidase [Pseudomonadota bacterium]